LTGKVLPDAERIGQGLGAGAGEGKEKVVAFHARMPKDGQALARLFAVKPAQTEVQEVTEDLSLPSKQIAVSQWIWLDSQPLSAQQLKVGDVVHLTLHREEEHTELKSLFVKDELIEGIAADRFHDATDWDVELMKAGSQ
jgi:hypothetical protein